MRIGLVLAATPTYSETFFRNKILMLGKAHHLMVFADRHADPFDLCEVFYGIEIRRGSPGSWLKAGYLLILGMLSSPRRILRLLYHNWKDGMSAGASLKSLGKSIHILGHQLDWIHYGFGTMALGRENVARAMGARMAVSFRGFDIGIYPLAHAKCYDLLWNKVDRIHVISDDLRELVRRNGCPEGVSVIKITPAIDTRKFSPLHRLPEISSPVNLLTIARLHWKKGIEYMLLAMSRLRQMGINFHYTIIGEGSERERLLFAVYQMGLDGYVTLAGKLPQNEIVKYYKAANLYLQYSVQEGFCNAVLEAQAMGLLCVVSDAEGLSENVLHGETGWVVPKRNPELLARQIEEILKLDTTRLHNIRQHAIQRVAQSFDLENQRQQFMNFYEIC